MSKISIDRRASVDEIANEMDRRGRVIESLEAERNTYRAKSMSRGRLLERFRDCVQNICDHATDEGDRVYFGSTNDLDTLREIAREMDMWKWDAIMREKPGGDPYADLREMRERAETAESTILTLKAENERLAKALEPFEKVADAVLAEAPIVSERWSPFKDCNGEPIWLELDELRAVQSALSQRREHDLTYHCDACSTPGYGPDAKCSDLCQRREHGEV